MPRPRKLRDISGFAGEPDMAFLQRKISAAGEMKTAIKKFIDWWEFFDPKDGTDRGVALVDDMKSSMETYLNTA